MPTLKKLAPLNPIYTVVDLTSSSRMLVNNELSLIKDTGVNFVNDLAKLSRQKRKSSIICKALSLNNRKDEDIVSEALLLLQEASIKYFEKDRDINFHQFAVTHIHYGIRDYINKQNHTNGSDLNEKIHSAIRAVKRCLKRKEENLTYFEAKHLANHFNLDEIKGIKKIFEFEAIQFGTEHDWRTNVEGEEYYRFDDQKKDIGASGYSGNTSDTVFKIVSEKQSKDILKDQVYSFLKICNKRESIIFKGRIFCQKQVSLEKLSEILKISFQMVFSIEKSLYKKFIKFSKDNIENKKNADI